MDDALPVGGRQGVCDLRRHTQRLRDWQRSLLKPRGKRLAGKEFHHQVGGAVSSADVVKCADVGVIQAGDRLGFALKPGATVSIRADVRWEHLDRDAAVEARVAGFVDLAHATGADGRDDLVGTKLGAR